MEICFGWPMGKPLMAEPIPFANQQASGYEPLGGAGELSLNVVSDATGTVRRRPGIVPFATVVAGQRVELDTAVNDSGLSGIFATDDGVTLAVSAGANRKVYEVIGSSVEELDTALPGLARPTFAQTEMLVVMAGGAEVLKYERAPRSLSLLGGDPPEASHVIAHNSRLLLNDVELDKTKVRYSGIAIGTTTFAGLEDWSFAPPAGFITAEARPDNVVGLAENTNEVFVFGQGTLQVYGPDAQAVYLPNGGAREYGTVAPYSIIKRDQAFAWLDQYRRFVVSDGRNFEVISNQIKTSLDGMARVDDCFGYRVIINSIDCLVWTFPTDGRTFVFQSGAGWGQWSGPARSVLPIQSHFFRGDTNTNVVGTTDGFLGQLSFESQTDLGDAIEAHVETGYINRGTERRKHCLCVYMTFRRGLTVGPVGEAGWLSYRDQPGPWEARIPVDLGGSTDTHPVLTFRSLGTYRRRQWRFEFSGAVDMILVNTSEEFEVLEE